MKSRLTGRLGVLLAGTALAATTVLSAAPAASAHPTRLPARHHHTGTSLGATTVTTAPGIATTLLGAGVLPLPVLPRTGVGISFGNGLQVSYTFPITASTANLSAGTGDIKHAGGILFLGRGAKLEVSRFDIDLAAGKVFATRVNNAPARVALLDLDLSGLKVGTGPGGSTVLSGIRVKLDPQGAGALNSTFGLTLPTDGSLVFGSARVVLR